MITYSILTESLVGNQAHQLGLSYMGFGRYGKDGSVSHVSKFGRLTPIHKTGHLETLKDGELKHLEHKEDEVFTNGAKGVRNALDNLYALKHKDSRVKISQKLDGSPSVVFGIHPETKRFFVASKSAFNKNPKINYTEDDIDRNHGHAPGLASKLKELLHHGPKLGVKGVVQGDMLFGEHDKHVEDGRVSYQPNTIKYSAPIDSTHGAAAHKAKVGVALHTKYVDGKAHLDTEIEHKKHKDVYVMPVNVDTSKIEVDHEFNHHGSAVGAKMKSIPKHSWDFISSPHIAAHVKTYINAKVRTGETNLSSSELIKHIHGKVQKEIDAVKTEKSKSAKAASRDELLSKIREHGEHIDTAFAIHKHLAAMKHKVIDSLDKNQTWDHHTSDGKETKPEGYVAIGHHGPLKLVDRSEFSRLNFLQSKNR